MNCKKEKHLNGCFSLIISVNVSCVTGACEKGKDNGCSSKNHKSCENEANYSYYLILFVHNGISYV